MIDWITFHHNFHLLGYFYTLVILIFLNIYFLFLDGGGAPLAIPRYQQ